MRLTTAIAVVSMIAVLAGPAALPSRAAHEIIVEGEDYETYGHNNIGGLEIGTAWCSGASNFLAAEGLDVPGEWIKLKVTFPSPACYSSHIAYQSAYSDTVALRVRIEDAPGPGQELDDDYLLTDGWGFG